MAKVKDPLENIVKVINSATCLSLSGKSNITYQVGTDPDSNIYLRIYGNTGGGFFSPEWVALAEVQQFIADAPKDKPLSSWTLHPIFRGRSANNPAFLMAALVHEKWLGILRGKKRGLEVLDEAPFMAKLEKLKGSTPAKKPAAKPAAKPQKTAPASGKPQRPATSSTGKTPVKKPAANTPRKRAAV